MILVFAAHIIRFERLRDGVDNRIMRRMHGFAIRTIQRGVIRLYHQRVVLIVVGEIGQCDSSRCACSVSDVLSGFRMQDAVPIKEQLGSFLISERSSDVQIVGHHIAARCRNIGWCHTKRRYTRCSIFIAVLTSLIFARTIDTGYLCRQVVYLIIRR